MPPRDGAERTIAAAKGTEKIAVEIKTFGGPSDTRDQEDALGQFIYYYSLLVRVEPGRRLFLAVTDETYATVLSEPGP